MDPTIYPNVCNTLESILENKDSILTIDECLTNLIDSKLPINDLEHIISKKPTALKRILECIVIESRKMASELTSEYLFQPKLFDLVGVIRSNGDFQPVVVTACYPSNNIEFVDIESLLDRRLEKAMYKGIYFFFSISEEEKKELYDKYSNLKRQLELETITLHK